MKKGKTVIIPSPKMWSAVIAIIIVLLMHALLSSCTAKRVAITDKSVSESIMQKDSAFIGKSTLERFAEANKMLSYEEVEEFHLPAVLDSAGRVETLPQTIIKRRIWKQQEANSEVSKQEDSAAVKVTAEAKSVHKNDVTETPLPRNNTAMWVFLSILLVVMVGVFVFVYGKLKK